MKRIFIFATVVALALAMGMGGAMAQENGSNDTGGVEPGEQGPVDPDDYDPRNDQGDGQQQTTNSSEDAISPDKFTQPIDNETTIVDWSYRPGMFVLTIEAEESKKLSMTEAGDFEEGTGSFNYKEAQLQQGTNRITMPVTDRPGAGVAVATRDSLEQGTGAFVSVGQIQRNPFKHFGGETGLFSGVILTTGFAALGAAYVVRSEDSGVVEA